jgi:hypothetical protein
MLSTENVENLHIRLREQLEKRGYSMAEASRLMEETSPQRLRDVVNGRQKIPADMLAKAAMLGVDIFYVLTGEHQVNEALTGDETDLLENYRHASDEQKRSIYQVSEAFVALATPTKPSHWHRSANRTPIIFFSGFEGELRYMQELAKGEGLKISEAGRVTRLTDWAVLSDTASKTHRTTAIDLNVPILNRADFYNMARTNDDD